MLPYFEVKARRKIEIATPGSVMKSRMKMITMLHAPAFSTALSLDVSALPGMMGDDRAFLVRGFQKENGRFKKDVATSTL